MELDQFGLIYYYLYFKIFSSYLMSNILHLNVIFQKLVCFIQEFFLFRKFDLTLNLSQEKFSDNNRIFLKENERAHFVKRHTHALGSRLFAVVVFLYIFKKEKKRLKLFLLPSNNVENRPYFIILQMSVLWYLIGGSQGSQKKKRAVYSELKMEKYQCNKK